MGVVAPGGEALGGEALGGSDPICGKKNLEAHLFVGATLCVSNHMSEQPNVVATPCGSNLMWSNPL